MASSTAAGLLARTGFDWLTIDFEHSPVSFETAATSFAIIAAAGKVPLARIPWNTGENIKRVLDTGAYGIVVPMVNSKEEAEAVVAASRYGHKGNGRLGDSCTQRTSKRMPRLTTRKQMTRFW